MAKKSNKTGLVLNLLVIIFAAIALSTLFFAVIGTNAIAAGKVVGDATLFKGTDVLTAMFADGISLDMSGEANALYLLRAAEDTAFVTTMFSWGYLITLCASAVALVFAVLNIIGLRFKLINRIVGIALVLVAVATFVFAILVAGEFTNVLGEGILETGTKGFISFGSYLLVGGLLAGLLEIGNSKN